MGSLDPRFPGKPAARRSRRNIFDATRTRTRLGDGTNRLIAHEEALCRLRRNEGRICRDLWPRVDMGSLVFGLWLDLLERLVGPEADDGQSQRIDGQLLVLHLLAEDVGDAGGPLLPLEFAMIRGIRINLLELDARRIG